MAILLHIETATEQCSVALTDNATLLAQKSILEGGFKHAAKLHVFIDEILREANISPSELDAVAISAGPGSFTGLRIGSVAAKGLCFALDIPPNSLTNFATISCATLAEQQSGCAFGRTPR